MAFHIILLSIWTDYGISHHPPAHCRGRFIAPTADLSALGGVSDIPIMLLNLIIDPTRMFPYPDYFFTIHHHPPHPYAHTPTTIAYTRRSRKRILPSDSLANNKCMNIVSALVRKNRLEIVGMAADGILQSDTVGAKD